MDGALFSLLFFFFAQISAGVAPMRWPQCEWLAGVIFWVSTAGMAICVVWYAHSQGWDSMAFRMIEQRSLGTGILVLICGVGLGVLGLSIIAAGDKPKPASSNSLPRSDVFTLAPYIYSEARSIKAADGRETNLWENSFYLMVGNQSEDGKTLRKAQARIQGYDRPVLLATIKDTTANETDIRHGEWAFFMVGRLVLPKPIGMWKGNTTIEDNFLKSYENNIPMGVLTFDVWSSDTKRQYGIAHLPEHPVTWKLPIVVSADDKKSLMVVLKINFEDQKTPVTYDNDEPAHEKN
ncbi:hypothetical protein IVB30_13260 [Bradyrhizobium sp. 200]|uniref:hypothetical protein n=1 Tax=Bradyrhizobium sp. 200 TaxID=2782665 RepID=UPI001FFFAA6B|nr:hypothetical protein [Bradyrhizobium sp. 200]UPJ52234.1 hypothetical protein IVB30_13260 [Bradyrhizobium sp. 200]